MQILDQVHGFLWESIASNNCNTYLIEGSPPILIDPGHKAHFGHVRQGLELLGLTPEQIGLVLCTHAHPDHLEAVRLFSLPTLWALHQDDWQLADTMLDYLSPALKQTWKGFEPDLFVQEGDLVVGKHRFQVLHTPGHSPGSIVLYWPEHKALFTGDLVFKAGMGRVDLPGGHPVQLQASLERIARLDVDYLLPGHGPILTDARAVRANYGQLQGIMLSGYL